MYETVDFFLKKYLKLDFLALPFLHLKKDGATLLIQKHLIYSLSIEQCILDTFAEKRLP
jgi:hypothetical protein